MIWELPIQVLRPVVKEVGLNSYPLGQGMHNPVPMSQAAGHCE